MKVRVIGKADKARYSPVQCPLDPRLTLTLVNTNSHLAILRGINFTVVRGFVWSCLHKNPELHRSVTSSRKATPYYYL